MTLGKQTYSQLWWATFWYVGTYRTEIGITLEWILKKHCR
jgi:hypothetical protein